MIKDFKSSKIKSKEDNLIPKDNTERKKDISKIIDNYKTALIKYFYWNTNNHEDAEDLFQETSIKIYRGIDNFKEECSLNTWIYKIASNTLTGFYRSKRVKNKEKILENYEDFYLIKDDRRNLEQEFLSKETESELWQVINKLSADLKRIFLLKEMFDFSYKEISEILDIPLGTVQSTLYRARKELISLINKKNNNG